jgi:hypothetical protein
MEFVDPRCSPPCHQGLRGGPDVVQFKSEFVRDWFGMTVKPAEVLDLLLRRRGETLQRLLKHRHQANIGWVGHVYVGSVSVGECHVRD